MNRQWSELFTKSTFVSLPVGPVEPADRQLVDFARGRLCALQALYFLDVAAVDIPRGSNRDPIWPEGFVGSISHSRVWAGAAVARAQDLTSVGIDFESVGRVTEAMKKLFINDEDVTAAPGLSNLELWTLIFSAKEALFKALFPLHKKFFYFDAAAVVSVDEGVNEFVISLLPEYRHLCVNGQMEFKGRYRIIDDQCLTVIEI